MCDCLHVCVREFNMTIILNKLGMIHWVRNKNMRNIKQISPHVPRKTDAPSGKLMRTRRGPVAIVNHEHSVQLLYCNANSYQ